MINGAHIIVYSRDAEADRKLLRDILEFPHVDVGHDWLIFRLPPAELAVHPSDENDRHELCIIPSLGTQILARSSAIGRAQGEACKSSSIR